MLMRPAPLNATGPSPRINTLDTTLQRVHPGLEQPPRIENRIGLDTLALDIPLSLLPIASTCSPVLVEECSARRILYTDKPEPHEPPSSEHRCTEGSRAKYRNGAASPWNLLHTGQYGAVICGNCHTDHRSIPRSRRGQTDRGRRTGDGDPPPRNPRYRGPPLREAEDRPHDHGDGGSHVPEVLDRVPIHPTYAGDPTFHRAEQEVVADDNTENHRRRVQPRNDNSGDNDRSESQYQVEILPDIAEATTDTADTTDATTRHRGCKINNDATSISSKSHVEKKETEKEKEKVFESRWKYSAESEREPDVGLAQKPSGNDQELEIAALGEYGSVDVAQVTQVTRSEHRHQFRKRRARCIDDKTCRLVFVFYLLALPILCATNGSPPGPDRGSSPAFAQNTSAQRNSSSRNPGVSPESDGHHPYRDYSWEVNQINPWLSACDLAGPAPADLQGSCGPPETPRNCPDACRKPDARASRAADSFFAVVSQAIKYRGGGGGHGVPRPETGGRAAPEQCLFYLEESHKTEICRDDFGKDSSERFLTIQEKRYRFLSGLRLRHCCEHAALNALASGDGGPLEEVLGGNDGCRKAIGKLLAVDALAARLHCEFGEVLARYDCGQPYSVIYNCSHCKEAYRRWVCSSLVPYFAHDDQPRQKNQGLRTGGTGMRIRPCRSFCQTVEQRCPYLLPGDRAPAYPTQYAGEPTFLCRDPNIPETGEQASRALHADEECCFRGCSDEDPGLGVCANCTEPQVEIAIRGGKAHRDPSTAPQCELNSASSIAGHHQSTPSESWSDRGSSSSSSTAEPGTLVNPGMHGGVGSLDVSSGTSHQSPSSSSGSGTSFCGSGGVGSMSSAAAPRVAPLRITMCVFCAWGTLIGMCAIKAASSWTTSESSPYPGRLGCNEVIREGNRRRRPRRRRRRRRRRCLRRSSSWKTIYLVIFGRRSIRSLLLGVYDVLRELPTACYQLYTVNSNWIYNRDLLLLGDFVSRRSPRNSTQPRRPHRRGCRHRRKKKRRRAS